VSRICGEAEVPRVCPHGLRGTWATLTTDAGVSGHVIAREMGHTTYAMTEKHYLEQGAKERTRARKMLTVVEGSRNKDW
jgi:integrase